MKRKKLYLNDTSKKVTVLNDNDKIPVDQGGEQLNYIEQSDYVNNINSTGLTYVEVDEVGAFPLSERVTDYDNMTGWNKGTYPTLYLEFTSTSPNTISIYGSEADRTADTNRLAYFEVVAGATTVNEDNSSGFGGSLTTNTSAPTSVGDQYKVTVGVGTVKSYKALLTQSGTGAPVATVLGNNTIGAIVWSRNGAGDYIATLANAFTVGKTFVKIGPTINDGTTNYANIVHLGSAATVNALEFVTYGDIDTAIDDVLLNTEIEIEVYP